jgi:hypothetical protein
MKSTAEAIYKYQSYLDTMNNCPPQVCEHRELTAFRFVSANVKEKENFLPPLIKTPQRIIPGNDKRCDGYGLSFFASVSQAASFYASLQNTVKNIHISIGTHIAEGNLKPTDGVCTKVNSQGHFTLHEYSNANLKLHFRIVKQVY